MPKQEHPDSDIQKGAVEQETHEPPAAPGPTNKTNWVTAIRMKCSKMPIAIFPSPAQVRNTPENIARAFLLGACFLILLPGAAAASSTFHARLSPGPRWSAHGPSVRAAAQSRPRLTATWSYCRDHSADCSPFPRARICAWARCPAYGDRSSLTSPSLRNYWRVEW